MCFKIYSIEVVNSIKVVNIFFELLLYHTILGSGFSYIIISQIDILSSIWLILFAMVILIIRFMMAMMNRMSYIFGFKHVTNKQVDATMKVMLKFVNIKVTQIVKKAKLKFKFFNKSCKKKIQDVNCFIRWWHMREKKLKKSLL